MLSEQSLTQDGPRETENPPIKLLRSERQENNFDFLRLVLASLVILSHGPEIIDGNRSREPLVLVFHTFSSGEFAVYGFFLLSGFLIVSSWLRKPDLKPFLEKRILRIFPGFIGASLICIFIVGPIGTNDISYFRDLNALKLFGGLVSLTAPRTPSVFAGTHYPGVNGTMWTISCEFRCYMIVAAFGVLGWLKDRRIWFVCTLLISALSIATYLHPISVWKSYFLFGCDLNTFARLLMFFFSGGAFYLYRDRIKFKPAYGLIALPLSALFLFRALWAPLAMATFGGYILFYIGFLKHGLMDRLRPVEDISYGVYLYGWPVQKLLLWWLPALSPASLFILSLGLAVPCGLLSWRFIEAPFLRLKRKIE